LFFNLFSAAEPSANICIIHGTYAMTQVSILVSVINLLNSGITCVVAN